MHIVLTVNYSPWSAYCGGGQLSTHQLANALGALGHEVEVIYTKPPWEKVEITERLAYGARFAPFCALRSRRRAVLRPFNALFVAHSVGRELSRRRSSRQKTVVHSQGEEGALIPLLRRRHSFGFVVTPRYPNLPEACLDDRPGLLKKTALGLFDFKYVALGRMLKAADRVCPTSRASAAQMARAYGLEERRLRIVPNGVNPVFLEGCRFADASGGPILFFGRLSRSKGPEIVLKAYLLLPPPRPRLLLVGRGELWESLDRRISGLGPGQSVSLLPWQPPRELARLLFSASMAVLPSREESFGNAMLEAMAAGAPLISTHVDSIPEIVGHEQTGLLVPPGDPDALAAAMTRLQKNPDDAEALGRRARQYARGHFSWHATAQRFVELYQGIEAAS